MALEFNGYAQHPVIVVTTCLSSGQSKDPLWWQKNFWLTSVGEELLLSFSQVQFFIIDQNLFNDVIRFTKVMDKIKYAVTKDITNNPAIIIIDASFAHSYKESKASSFKADKLDNVLGTIAPTEIIVPFNAAIVQCSYTPAPEYPVNIGSIIRIGDELIHSDN